MKYYSQWNNTAWKFVYTIPWPLPVLYISTLTNDDTTSICPVVQTLIIDKVCSNISHRFPNIVTLLIQPGCSLPSDDYTAFRRLRHLTTTNITQVPSSVLQRLHTLTLSIIQSFIGTSNISSSEIIKSVRQLCSEHSCNIFHTFIH